MLLSLLLLIPIAGIILIGGEGAYEHKNLAIYNNRNNLFYKKIALFVSILNLIISLIIYILFDFSSNNYQFVQEHYDMSFFDIYLGIDGLSIYFVLLTTIIMPIAILSN
jgi:NADH-ubiquinone oxidoreductase chain 4